MGNKETRSIEEILNDPNATVDDFESLSPEQQQEWEQRFIAEEEKEEMEKVQESHGTPFSLGKVPQFSLSALGLSNTAVEFIKNISAIKSAPMLQQASENLPDTKPNKSKSASSTSSPDPYLIVPPLDTKLLTQSETRDYTKWMYELTMRNQRIQEERHKEIIRIQEERDKENQRFQEKIHKDNQKYNRKILIIVALTLLFTLIMAWPNIKVILEEFFTFIESAIALL